jgi:hypothetical protein
MMKRSIWDIPGPYRSEILEFLDGGAASYLVSRLISKAGFSFLLHYLSYFSPAGSCVMKGSLLSANSIQKTRSFQAVNFHGITAGYLGR